jgi:hypothetical protein
LAFVALRSAQPSTYFAWQPFLIPGLEWGVFEPTARSVELVPVLSNFAPSESQITERLRWVASYTDDEHWCAQQAAELGLERLQLTRINSPHYPWDLIISGEVELLRDPRVVSLVRQAMAYKRAQGLRIRSGHDLITVASGRPLYGQVNHREIDSDAVIRPLLLDRLEAAGHGL